MLSTWLDAATSAVSNTWVSRGPYQGAVLGLVQADGLYAATPRHLFWSTDRGETWSPIWESPDGELLALLRAGAPPRLFVGTTAGLHVSDPTLRSFRAVTPSGPAAAPSTSTGSTAGTPAGADANAVAGLSAAPDGRILAGTVGGILVSADDGETWRPLGPGLPAERRIVAVAAQPSQPDTLYAGGDWGLWRTDDAGATWHPVANVGGSRYQSGEENVFWVTSIVFHPADPNLILLTANGLEGGLYLSRDGGATWTRAHEALNSNDVNLVVFDPSNADTIYAGAGGTANTESIGGVFVSYDRGHTWSQIKSKLTNTVVQSLAVDPAPPLTLYAGSSGGATFRYDGAGRWQLVTSALPLLRTLEPLLLGLALAALVILFAGLRRLPKTE